MSYLSVSLFVNKFTLLTFFTVIHTQVYVDSRYLYTYICMYAYMHACMYVYMHVCMHVCMYVYICIYIMSVTSSIHPPVAVDVINKVCFNGSMLVIVQESDIIRLFNKIAT